MKSGSRNFAEKHDECVGRAKCSSSLTVQNRINTCLITDTGVIFVDRAVSRYLAHLNNE